MANIPPPMPPPPPDNIGESVSAIIRSKGQLLAWIPDEKNIFISTIVNEVIDNNNNTVTSYTCTVEGKQRTFPAEQVYIINNEEDMNMSVDDLVHLDQVNEPSILHSVGLRFSNDQIYTNLGTIVISVNPFKWIDGLYGPELIEKYSRIRRQGVDMPPHIYTIADAALCSIVEEATNQSIIISGESGAGKTEAVKKCLQYISIVAGNDNDEDKIEERILSSNPVLEAFGNAKTLRNNNSSRFGKFMQIHFDPSAKILGCSNTSYLLEKSRVVFQDQGERNFHIFYLLCKGASDDMLKELKMKRDPNNYKYINQSGCMDVDGINDASWYKEVLECFTSLGLNYEKETMAILRVVASILLLGNVSFAEDLNDSENSVIKETGASLDDIAALLGVDVTKMKTCLVERRFQSGGRSSMVQVPMKFDQASSNRDSLCKEMYSRLFNWLIFRINKSMNITGVTKSKIGVLDIFGFEIFEKNSFEQMCINFANEKLQQHFTSYTFKMENALYKSEGIDFKGVPYIDNQNVLDLLEKKRTGLFSMLNEELRVPRGSSQGFYNKAVKKHVDNELFKSRTKDACFTVSHYAGTVTYSSEMLLEKNRDSLFEDLLNLLSTSSISLISQIYGGESTRSSTTDNMNSGNTKNSRRSGKQSIATMFGVQLASLMKTLYSTTPHYIRCVKPNTQKKPGIFTRKLVMEQLKYSGIFEAVTIRKSGYPFRYSHEQFWKRFKCLVNGIDAKSKGNDYAGLSSLLLDALVSDIPEVKHCILGKTLVLYRAEQNKILESSRGIVRLNAAITCQHSIKVGVAKLQVKRWLKAYDMLRRACDSNLNSINELKSAVAFCKDAVKGSEALSRTKLGAAKDEAIKLIKRLEEIARIEKLLKELFLKPPLDIFEPLGKLLEDARKVEYESPDITRGKKLFESVSLALKIRDDIATAAIEFDYDLIIEARPKLIQLQSVYGSNFGKEELVNAIKAQNEIESEWKEQMPKLQRAIKKGAVMVPDETTKAEEWTKRALANVSIAHLQYAEEEGKMANIKSKRGKDLLLGIKVLQVVRALLIEGEWEAGMKDLSKLENVKDKHLKEEVNAIRSAYAVHSQIPLLLDALRNGQASGPAPSSIQTIELGALEKTVKLFAVCDFTAPDILSLVNSSGIVLAVRKLWKEKKWIEMESVLNENNIEKLHNNVRVELRLAKVNCKYTKLMNAGTYSIEKECIKGKVGKLYLLNLKLDSLQATIKGIKDIKSNAVASDKMVQTLEFLLSLRKFVNGGKMESLLKHISGYDITEFLISSQDEIELCKRHGEDKLFQDRLKKCLSSGNVAGEPGTILTAEIDTDDLKKCLADSEKLNLSNIKTKQLVLCGTDIIDFREKILKADWDSLFDLVKTLSGNFSFFERSQKEAEKVQHEVMERLALEKLQNALNTGKIQKKDETDIDYVAISTEAIKVAFEFIKEWNCTGMKVRKYQESVKAIQNVRSNLKAENWIKLKIDISSVLSHVEVLIKDEMQLAKSEVDNVEFIEHGNAALKAGGPVGKIGSVAIELIDTAKLEKHVKFASSLSRLRNDAQKLLSTCQLVLKNRMSLANGSYDSLITVSPEDITVFNDVAHGELKRMRQEKENYLLTKALREGMDNGKVTGVPGDLMKESISCKAINDAIALSEKYGVLSEEASGLMEDCEKISKLRNQCSDDKWDDLSISIINIQNHMFYSRQKRQNEFDLISKHSYNHSLITKAMKALVVGAPVGIIGSLDSDSIDLDLLDDVLQYEVKHGCHSSKAQKIMQLVKGLKIIRDLVQRNIWSDVLEKQIKSLNTIVANDAKDVVPTEVRGEIARVQDELDHKRVLDKLKTGLKHGKIVGKIGQINKAVIKYEDLKKAIYFAEKTGCKSKITQNLKAHASSILEIRQSLLACLWSIADKSNVPELWEALEEDINKADRPEYDEVIKARGELFNYQNIEEMKAALKKNNVDGTLEKFDASNVDYKQLDAAIHSVDGRGLLTTHCNFLYGLCKQFSSLRRSVLSNHWEQLKDVSSIIKKKIVDEKGNILPKIPRVCLEEVQLCFTYAVDRLLITSMQNVLKAKAISGQLNDLKVAKTNLKKLESVISNAEETKCQTVESIDLLKTCKCFLELRKAVSDLDWDAISKCLQLKALKSLSDGDLGYEEYITARTAEEENNILLKLRAAIDKGAPIKLETPKTTFLDCTTVNTEDLESAITFASEVGCKTKESEDLKKLADYTLKIRQYLECTEIEKAGNVCNDAIANNINSEEITIVSMEYRNKNAVDKITTALDHGQVNGAIGHLNLSTIQFHPLQLCLNDGKEISPKTMYLEELLDTGNRICKLRELVYKSLWNEVTEMYSKIDEDFTGMSKCCHTELSKIRSEMLDKNASKVLQSTVSAGSIAGLVGSLNLKDVEVSGLLVQIKYVESLQEISELTRKQLETARRIVNLRQLVTKDMWEPCAALVEKTDIASLAQKEAIVEFNLVFYHLKFRNAVSLMEKALVSECVFVDGEDGIEISLNANSKEISHALALAQGLVDVPEVSITNLKFKSLLITVDIVYNMRSAGLLSRWEAVKMNVDKCIHLVEQNLFFKTAADEVNRAEDYYFGWKIVSVLNVAISTGSIRLDANRNCFREGVEYRQIENALDTLQDMKTSNARANDMLRGAISLYQIRNAIKNDDLETLDVIIQELKEIKEPTIVNELDIAKKIANDYNINLKLNNALIDIDHVEDEKSFQIALRKIKVSHGSGTSAATVGFVAFCEYIVLLKERLLGERWEELADALSNPPLDESATELHVVVESEIQRITEISLNYIIQRDIKNALEQGDITGDVNQLDISSLDYSNLEDCIARAVKKISHLDKKSKSLLQSARYVHLVRETAGSSGKDFEELLDVISKDKVDNVDIEAKDELALVYHYVQNLIARRALRTELKHGCIEGTFEELNLKNVSVTTLRQTIEQMSQGFHMADATSKMLNLATFVEVIRKNISNLNKLELLLQQAPETVDPFATEELTLVKRFYYNCKLKIILEDIFAENLPSIKEMTEALAFSKQCEVVDENNRIFLNSARCLLALKRAGSSKDKDWVAKIIVVLHDSEGYGKDLCTPVIDELKKTRIELEDKQAAHILRTAMATGGPEGTVVGELDLDNIDVQQLDAAINDVSLFIERSDQTDVLLRSARILRLARIALQKNNFNAVENFDKVCIEAKEEFQLILDELWNNQLQKHLNEVLSRGKVIGFVGNLRMEVVQTEPLAIVLADSENEDHIKSKRTIELIGCARLVLSLRRGISGKIVNSHEMYTLIEKYDGKLFESAEMEIQLIKDEVSLRMTLSVLEASLEHQSLKELVAAIESAEALPTMNSQGRQLLRFAKLMKALLVAEEKEDWDNIRHVLSTVNETEEPMPTSIVMKFHSARVRLDNRNAEQLLTEAICTGCVSGTIEQINYDSISTEKLDRALMATKNVEELNATVEDLARVALAIRECRRCISSKKISLLEKNALMIGKVEIIDIAKDEAMLVRDCVDDKKIINLFSSALMSDETSGTSALDEAIEHAQHVGCKSRKATELLKSAYIVVRIRQLRQNGNWEALLEYTKDFKSDLTNISEQEVKKAISDCLHYARTVLVAREAMNKKDWPSVRSALALYDSFPPLGDARIEEEIDAIRDEANDRTVCEAFRHALSQGGAQGHAGRVVTTSIRLSLLDKSISLANDLGCSSSEAQSFYRTAYVIQQLRTAAKANEWLAVEAVLQHALPGGVRELEAGSSLLDSIANDELRLLLDHIVDMKMMKIMNEAIMTGRIVTDIDSGEVDIQAVDPKPLAHALNFVEENTCRSETAGNLARNVGRLHTLRTALVSRDWVGVFKVVKESANEEMTRLEMTSALNAVANMRSEESLRLAIKENSIDGVVGHLIYDKIKLEHLDEAIKSAREAGIASKRVEILLNTAQIVRRLRYAVMENDWEEVEQTISTAALLAATGKFAADAEAEMNLCLEEVEDKRLQTMLNKAMTSSGSRMLKDAIAVSRSTILIHSETTQELLNKAIFLADIREAHELGDMVRVQGLSSSVPIASLNDDERKEVTLLLNIANDTLLMDSLWEAIQSPGQALYINGKLDTSTISRSRLLLAISDAKQENIISEDVLLILDIAQSLAALRGHISAHIWSDAYKEVEKLATLCKKLPNGNIPKSLRIEILNAKTESFKFVTEAAYSKSLYQIVKVQSIVRRFIYQKAAKERLDSAIVVQKHVRTFNAKKLKTKLIVKRNDDFLAEREKEKQRIKKRNIQQWDLAANSIVKDIERGIHLSNSPDVPKSDAIKILSRSLKVGRAIKLHQHHDARVIAQIVRCEKILRELLLYQNNTETTK